MRRHDYDARCAPTLSLVRPNSTDSFPAFSDAVEEVVFAATSLHEKASSKLTGFSVNLYVVQPCTVGSGRISNPLHHDFSQDCFTS